MTSIPDPVDIFEIFLSFKQFKNVKKSYFILEKMSSSVEKIELSIIKHDDVAPQSGRSNEAAGKTISVTDVDERNDGLTENTELSQVNI